VGSHLVNLQIKNQVAILYSVDSANALDFMPFTSAGPQWSGAKPVADYSSLIHQFHRILYESNIGVDFVFPENPNFAGYKLLIVPALYIADDALLGKITQFVKGGGHVLMTFKSGFCNENSMVRWTRQPGPLREAAGFSYQEFSNLEKPLSLKGDPFHAGEQNNVMYWAEFLMPEGARTLAYYDHPFFGRWPAITRNQYGAGTLTYEGTYLSDGLQKQVVTEVLKSAGLSGPDGQLPPPIRVKQGVNALGKRIHYYLNYSSAPQTFTYPHGTGTDLLTGRSIGATPITLSPWDLVIVEEP
jgi:beta-galactosidase